MAKWVLHTVAFTIYVTIGPVEDCMRYLADHLDCLNLGWNIISAALSINTLN